MQTPAIAVPALDLTPFVGRRSSLISPTGDTPPIGSAEHHDWLDRVSAALLPALPRPNDSWSMGYAVASMLIGLVLDEVESGNLTVSEAVEGVWDTTDEENREHVLSYFRAFGIDGFGTWIARCLTGSPLPQCGPESIECGPFGPSPVDLAAIHGHDHDAQPDPDDVYSWTMPDADWWDGIDDGPLDNLADGELVEAMGGLAFPACYLE